MAKILIHVQHLLGSGHAHRMAAVAAALAEAGHDTTLASGGAPLALAHGRARLVQLPWLRAADASFKDLRNERDQTIDDAWRDLRARATLELFAHIDPDLLIVELYPFGRSMLAFELEKLLEKAAAIPVLGSVRDVLQRPADDGKAAKRIAAAGRYAAILVHGDREFLPLEASWPEATALADKLVYTGYVASQSGTPATGRDEIVVSVGGGAAGAALLETALACAARRAHGRARWRIRVGNAGPLPACDNRFVTIENNRPDFVDLLHHARLSISQAGYNTCVDLLQARCPAILVPFAAGNEREQTIRAAAFAHRGLALVLGANQTLDDAIDAAQAPTPHDISCAGAAIAAKLVAQWL
jgi:predicted glycosyltransferase